jgi:hypothetical protein
MAVGRPTIYEALTVAKAVKAYVEKRQAKRYIPTIEGLAVHLGVSRDTLYEWEDKYPDFSDILEQLRAAQADQLIQNGLIGYFNSTITKLMLTKHGYADRQELTGADGSKLFDDAQAKQKARGAIAAFFGRGDKQEQ